MTGHLSRAEYIRVKTSGKTYRYKDFSAILCTGTGKFAVVASTKLDKRAVVRNKLRRRIYASVHKHKTVDAIIFPSKSMLKLQYAEINSRLDSFLSALYRQPA